MVDWRSHEHNGLFDEFLIQEPELDSLPFKFLVKVCISTVSVNIKIERDDNFLKLSTFL